MLLPQFYQEHRQEVKNLLLKMADDSCWWVRETAASAFAKVWAEDFEKLFPLYEKWRRHPSENVRWNLAMSVSSSGGVKYPEESLRLLKELAKDERKSVWRAVVSALRSLGKKHPELVKSEMKKWLKERKRKTVAENVLKFLKKSKR